MGFVNASDRTDLHLSVHPVQKFLRVAITSCIYHIKDDRENRMKVMSYRDGIAFLQFASRDMTFLLEEFRVHRQLSDIRDEFSQYTEYLRKGKHRQVTTENLIFTSIIICISTFKKSLLKYSKVALEALNSFSNTLYFLLSVSWIATHHGNKSRTSEEIPHRRGNIESGVSFTVNFRSRLRRVC